MQNLFHDLAKSPLYQCNQSPYDNVTNGCELMTPFLAF